MDQSLAEAYCLDGAVRLGITTLLQLTRALPPVSDGDRTTAATDVVAAYVCDPNARAWHKNIESFEWKTEPQASRVQGGIRWPLPQTTTRLHHEITEYVPSVRLVMKTAQGPFPMETTYTFSAVEGSTQMALRNRGEPAGFSSVWMALALSVMPPRDPRSSEVSYAARQCQLPKTGP